jgi:hypothetical protein
MEKNLIFHYTSTEVLLKILSRGHESLTNENLKDKICLRATHAKFLNDPTEYELALSLLKQSLLSYEKENPNKTGVSQIFTKDNESDLISLAPGEPFLFALSENLDNLSMWQSYGLNGSGVAIGLDKKMLEDYGSDEPNTLFIPCSYDFNENISKLTTFWSSIYDKMPLYIQKGTIVGRDIFKFLKILGHCFSIKDNAYKDEREWRLCKNEAFKENIKYRIRSGLIIPYIEHFVSKDIINNIVIGPCADKELSKKSIIMALKTFGFDLNNISVTTSTVPFRQ